MTENPQPDTFVVPDYPPATSTLVASGTCPTCGSEGFARASCPTCGGILCAD